jgi:hypothetical protein
MNFIQSSEEETVGGTEGNKIPAKQRRKLPPAEDGASSTVCAVSHVFPKENFYTF